MSFQNNTVVLDVVFHKPMRHRRGNLNDVEIDADKDSITLSTDIIRSEHYVECESIQRKFDVFLKTRMIKSPFRKGVYLLPIGVLEEVYARLESARAAYDTAADALRDEWDKLVESAKSRLRSQFDSKSMPTADALRRSFWVEWKVLQFTVPDQATLGEVLYEKEAQKAKESWIRLEQEVSLALRESLNQLLGHLVQQLSDKADGSKSKLKQAAVDKVNDFLDTFSKRNVLNDTEMQKLVDKARKVLDGKDAGDLKSAGDSIKSKMQPIVASLDKLITKQKRVFDKD